jgi:uncharacterized repeat protein (TIGR03803 family)
MIVRLAAFACAGAMFAGCTGGNQGGIPVPPVPAQSAVSRVRPARMQSHGYSQLYLFGKTRRNPEVPQSGLMVENGTLYGTTTGGGSAASGTVFDLTAHGAVRVVYNFTGGPWNGTNSAAADPQAVPVALDNELYGTAAAVGDVTSTGAVYAVDVSTKEERLVHRFGGPGDGVVPAGSLVAYQGTLYGTTASGGTYGYGAVYSLNPKNGKERVLYSFGATNDDGNQPGSDLVVAGGKLYGTTVQGGGAENVGVIFAVTLSGQETVVHRFKGSNTCGPTEDETDGANPKGPLTVLNGKIYGSTECGGSTGSGSVFEFDPTRGSVRTLYGFSGGTDGAYPNGVIAYDGAIYGTTRSGGKPWDAGDGVIIYCGVVYRMTANGQIDILYEFNGGVDGYSPNAPLAMLNGALYGTTQSGGLSGGTAFRISLSQK